VRGKLQIGRPTEDPNVTEWVDIAADDITVDLTLDTSAFQKDMDAVNALMGRDTACPEMCQVCNVVQCLGDDPHAERFGPFHVFPEHDHFAMGIDDQEPK
jgi:hypothetical protein